MSGCSLYFWQYLLGRLRQCLPEMLVSCFYIIYCVATCLLPFESPQLHFHSSDYWNMVTSTVFSGKSFDLCDSIAKPFIHRDVINLISNTVVVVYPLPWPLLVGGVRCSRLWSTSQLLRPSGQQCSHSGGVCPQIQGRQCGAYVGAVEEMMCVVCVDVTEGA